MSLSRYSELTIVVALVAAVLTAGVAGAVSVADPTVPEEGEVGEEVTLEAELTELYSDHEQWRFAATSELQNAEWTVELYRDGELVDTQEDTGDQTTPLELDQTASDAPDTIVVSVTGDVPSVSEYSYEDGQQFQALELLGNNGQTFEIESYSADHYTADSREARGAIEDARTAIDDADEETVSEAEARYDDAVAAYDDGNFDDAVAAADEAVALLESDDQSSDDENATATDADADVSEADADENDAAASADDDEGGIGIGTILLYGLGALALAAVGGGVLYFRQQQQSPNRDPLG